MNSATCGFIVGGNQFGNVPGCQVNTWNHSFSLWAHQHLIQMMQLLIAPLHPWMGGCQCQSQTSTGSTLWSRLGQVWPYWESVASASSTSWWERNVTLYYCCNDEYYDLFSLCSPLFSPLPCVYACLSVWLGVVFIHLTAIRSPHFTLSAQDHPSYSFTQPVCFSSHSTCSPKGSEGLLNKS